MTEAGAALVAGEWDASDMKCLARGPDGDAHVFAGGGTSISLASPETVFTADGALHAFALGQDHSLWHFSRSAGAWSMPVSLGKDVLSSPAVCSWGGSRIDVFVVGADGGLYHPKNGGWHAAAQSSSLAPSACRNGSCHPMGELRGS